MITDKSIHLYLVKRQFQDGILLLSYSDKAFIAPDDSTIFTLSLEENQLYKEILIHWNDKEYSLQQEKNPLFEFPYFRLFLNNYKTNYKLLRSDTCSHYVMLNPHVFEEPGLLLVR